MKYISNIKMLIKKYKIHKKFACDFLWNTTSSYLITIISLIRNFAILKCLSVEDYGRLQFIFATIPLVEIFLLGGSDYAATQYVAGKKEWLVSKIVRVRLLFSVLSAISCFIIGLSYYNTDIALAIAFFANAFITPLSSYDIVPAIYKGRGQYKNLAKVDLLIGIIVTIGSVLWVYFFPQNIIVLSIIPNFVTGIVYFIMVRRLNLEIKVANYREYIEALKYVFNRSVIGILPLVVGKIDQIIVGYFLGFADLAVYSLARFVQDKLKITSQALVKIYLPMFTTMEEHEIEKNMVKISVLHTAIILVGAFIFDFGATILIKMFFWDNYKDALLYVHLLLLGYVVSVPGQPLQVKLAAKKMIKIEYIYNMIISSVYLIILPVLVKYYYVAGVAYAYIIRGILNTLVTVGAVWLFKRLDAKKTVADMQ